MIDMETRNIIANMESERIQAVNFMQQREGRAWKHEDTVALRDRLRRIDGLVESLINRARQDCKCRAVVR